VSGSRLAIAEGHGVVAAALAAGASPVDVAVYGNRAVTLLDAESFVVLPRHGVDGRVLPHLVDHEANLRAVHALGCDRVVALSSVGGLRRELGVGSLVVPHDVIALQVASPLAGVPSFDRAWRARVVDAWPHDADAPSLVDGGVYWQTSGPRFETPAEIRFIAQFADLVGMTVASESFAAQHVGLAYAAVCVVDNLANGIGDAELTVDEYHDGARATRDAVARVFSALVAELSS
jgi:5'-methylthioadenosine phosphorylase